MGIIPGVPTNYLPTRPPVFKPGPGGDSTPPIENPLFGLANIRPRGAGGAAQPAAANTAANTMASITANAAKSSTAIQPRAAKKPAPKPVSALEKWLAGDTTYQQQLAEFNKSKSDYGATYNKQLGVTNRDYNETQRELNLQGQKDRMDQQNDFAGRGILHSGVYAQALGDYNTDFNTKQHNLVTGRTDKVGDLADQRNSFLRELQLQMNAAKQDAIRRRAQSLGL
jgi:hypothetical protein